MPANLPPSEWEALSRALQQTIDEWRQAHPTATMDEIERVIDTYLAPLRAKLVEATAQASSRHDWQHLAPAKQPSCATCGVPLVAWGQHRRRLQTTGGASVELERTGRASAPSAGRAFSPLDEELGLTSASLMPHALEGLVRLSTWLSFRRAAEVLAALTGVQVSEATARRWTETSGAAACAVQSEQTDTIRRGLPLAPHGAERLLLSADGAFVPLLHGEWAEAKLLVLGEVTTDPAGQPQATALSYFAQVAEAEAFSQAALVETHRRGLERAQAVGAVTDGAEWLQGLGDDHRADAVRILDFAHAASYLSQLGQAVQAAGTPLAPSWLTDHLHALKHDGPAEVLSELRELAKAHPEVEAVQGALAHLEKREGQMQYPTYQMAGWPIGSGSVESGHQVVMQARLKGPGMHGERTHVNPLLALRAMECNDRWAEGWADLRNWRQRERRWKRRERAEARLVRRWAMLLYWRARLRLLATSQREPTASLKEGQNARACHYSQSSPSAASMRTSLKALFSQCQPSQLIAEKSPEKANSTVSSRFTGPLPKVAACSTACLSGARLSLPPHNELLKLIAEKSAGQMGTGTNGLVADHGFC